MTPRLVVMGCQMNNYSAFTDIGNSIWNSIAETDASDVYRILTKMNVKKSVGYDDIPCKFLKIGATPLAGILCQMVNISLNECNFPDMLKFAEIAALLKKLDRLVNENYRPVCILTAISKVFERVFGNQLSTFFDQIFSKFLSGFRQRYSFQTYLLRMIEDWK